MIEVSVILAFDGTIITGLFVFYAFFIALAKRFEDLGELVRITNAIHYLAGVQLLFALSAILALFDLTVFALGLTTIGLILLIVCFFLLAFDRWLFQRSARHPPSVAR
jgi:hypothetical protein